MFKRKKVVPFDKPVCAECLGELKCITVFCFEDKDTYDIKICPNCCKDPLTLLRLAEKPPYDKKWKNLGEVYEYYGKGITEQLNKTSKLFEAMHSRINSHIDNHGRILKMKIDSGVRKK